MKTQERIIISNGVKIGDYMPTLVAERRCEKSERRVNDNNYYTGPARRMNIDRRK